MTDPESTPLEAVSPAFKDFHFHPSLQEGLDIMGFQKPTPIQTLAIPHILEGKDVIAVAQTGTGKTAAYLLPILHLLKTQPSDGVKALVLAPTRELAVQIDQQLEGFSYYTDVSSYPVYGGKDGFSFDSQKHALTRGADIIVATPGKLLSHMILGYVDMSRLRFLVLDEADRMLDMGFYDDIMQVIHFLPPKRQGLLFSATMPSKIRDLASKILKDPIQVNVAISKPAAGIHQVIYEVLPFQKIPLVCDIMSHESVQSAIIFASTKSEVKRLEIALQKLGLVAKAIHSDLDQGQREEVLSGFKAKRYQVLVATDILSRGIDIEGLNMVINFDLPPDPEDYVHRIGRTARADKTGKAITLVTPTDKRHVQRIEKLIERSIEVGVLPPSVPEATEAQKQSAERMAKEDQGRRGSFRKPGGHSSKGYQGRNSNRNAPHSKKRNDASGNGSNGGS